jgi:hypothetical protein
MVCVCLPGTVAWSQKWPKLSLKGHNRRQNLDLLLWPRNQTAFLLVVKLVLSMPEERQASWFEHQEQVGDTFLTARELIIRNLFLQAKRLTSITTGRFLNVWMSKCAENIQNDGKTRTGLFTATMCQHTLLCQCNNFWLLKTWLWTPTLLIWPLWFLLIFENKITAETAFFPGCVWSSRTIADYPTRDLKM